MGDSETNNSDAEAVNGTPPPQQQQEEEQQQEQQQQQQEEQHQQEEQQQHQEQQQQQQEQDEEKRDQAEETASSDARESVSHNGDNDNTGHQTGDSAGAERAEGEAREEPTSGQSTVTDEDRKVFIGGISWETGENELKNYFSKFGSISSIHVKTDPSTGRSRGFAFVIFENSKSVKSVLETPEHVINNKKVEAKRAKSRPGKVFVGGLKPEISDDDIREHFAKFGVVSELELPQDKSKGQRKNFCFVTFDQLGVVQELVRSGKTTINGIELDVKRATPKGEPGSRGAMASRGAYSGSRATYGNYSGYEAYGYAGYAGYPGYGYGGYGGYGAAYAPEAYGYTGYSSGKMRGSTRGGRYQPY